LKLLDGYLQDLLELQPVNFSTYQDEKLIHRTVERTIHLAIEASLDIGQRLIAQAGWRTPVDNRDTFTVLHENEIVSTELLPHLMNMAGFRNIIVHDYTRIDDEIVFGVLKRHLDKFQDYAEAIIKYIADVDG